MSQRDDTPDRETVDHILRIEELCDRYEVELRSGRMLTVIEFLAAAGLSPESAPDELVRELARLETEYRRPAAGDGLSTAPHNPLATSTLITTGNGTAAPTIGAPSTGALPAPVILGYEIEGELGRGAMGVVYRARDTRLNRAVALKMVLAGGHADRREILRFMAEAEAVAAIKHPNVVQVFELGEQDGRPFIAMELVGGESLAARLKRCPLPPRDAAGVVEQIARGVAAAHDQGIVHRDLKPANVLLDEDGPPKVTDFGLAKRAGGADLTHTGAIMGTPQYMAPEQASGGTKFVGPQADVWSLGVILYESLTGKRPFDAASIEGVLSRVMMDEPGSMRGSASRIPRDLEVITRKCLEKRPGDRYPTATELADDLGRFARREPILARPAGRAERLVRWTRRKPTAAAAAGLSVLAVVLAVVVFVVVDFWGDAESARVEAVRLRGIADQALSGEAAAKKEVAFLNYAHAVDLAFREYLAGNIARARELLDACPPELRHWEWRYVHRLCHADRVTLSGHTQLVYSACFSGDGSRVVTASEDNTARVWDAESGKELTVLRGHTAPVYSASFSADGKRIVTASLGDGEGPVRLWDAGTGKELFTLIKGDNVGSHEAWFSQDGRRVVAALSDKTARIWDAASGKELVVLRGHTGRVQWASFSADGTRVVTGSDGVGDDQTARVWEAETGKELAVLKAYRPSFSRDGRRVIAVAGWNMEECTTVRVWDAESGKELAVLGGHTGPVVSTSFSADGRRILTGSVDRTARVWDAESGKHLLILEGHMSGVDPASFSADGRRILTGSVDRTARVWDAESGKQLTVLKGHTGELTSASFSVDGERVVTASQDGSARVWHLPTDKSFPPWRTNESASITFSLGGRRVVSRVHTPGGPAIRHDADYFLNTAQKALETSYQVLAEFGQLLEPLVARYPRAVEAVVGSRPRTLVHGTYRPIQIILDARAQPPRLCPVDWEKAGVGSCFFDLAFLADGFDPERLAQIFGAYRAEAERGGLRVCGEEEMMYLVHCHRLHRIFNWIAVCRERNFPAEKVTKLHGMAERVGRLVLGG